MGARIQELFLAAAFEGEIDELKDRVKELEGMIRAFIDGCSNEECELCIRAKKLLETEP